MKIFISWSGNTSKAIAEALRDWLPSIIQRIEPWISSGDIEKGTRWFSDIGKQLNTASCGIVCLTPGNLMAPWILFEVGALSKTLDQARVCPYLYNLKPTDIKGPLAQFQATVVNKEDTRKLMQTINKTLDKESLPEKHLEKAFDLWWPELEKNLQKIPKEEAEGVAPRSDREILEEVLSLIRIQSREGVYHPLTPLGFNQPIAGQWMIPLVNNAEIWSGQPFKIGQPLEEVQQNNAEKKLGPTDPCPCGSGKKFENCHGDFLPPKDIQ